MVPLSLLTAYSALDIPFLYEVPLDADAIAKISQAERLGNLTSKSVTATFAFNSVAFTNPASPTFADIPESLHRHLRILLRSAIVERQLLIVSLIRPENLAPLQEFFGTDEAGEPLLQPIGKTVIPRDFHCLSHIASLDPHLESDFGANYLETPHLPIAINPSSWCQAWCRSENPEHQRFIRAAFYEIPGLTISSRNYHALRECGADVLSSPRVVRLLRSPKFWAYTVVFVYSCLRALPVMFVKNFTGHVWLLWVLDVVTAVPYTWGILTFITGRNWAMRYFGLVITLGTFITPYIYFWTNGDNYPLVVNLVVFTMIAAAIGYEVFNFLRDRSVAAGLSLAGEVAYRGR